MTSVYLDGVKLDITDDGRSTVGELIGALEKEIGAGGRLISEVTVDGRQRMPDSANTDRLASHGEVRFTTAPFAVMAAEGFRLIKDAAAAITSRIDAYALEARVKGGAFPSLQPVFIGLIEVIRNIEAISRADRFYKTGLFRVDPASFCEELAARCAEVRKAEERLDPISVADILEYEVVPLITGLELRLLSLEVA